MAFVNGTRAPDENEEYMKAKALCHLMSEVQKGWDSAEQSGWVSEGDAYRLLEVERSPTGALQSCVEQSTIQSW